VVDGVSDVVDVDASNLRPTPDLGAPNATDHISGLLQAGERMVVLLDIDRLIGSGVLQMPATRDAAA
jgi:purine-binding chemotaxis protein CheW